MTELTDVPQIEASLLVASTCTGEAPGSPSTRAGSCTSPPPPTTASTKPAKSPAIASRARTIVDGSTEVGQSLATNASRSWRVSTPIGLPSSCTSSASAPSSAATAASIGSVDPTVGNGSLMWVSTRSFSLASPR